MTICSFAQYIACVLNVACPEIRQTGRLRTVTQIAEYVPNTRVMYVRASASDADKAFAIAHEMRHLWQLSHQEELLGGYQMLEDADSATAYNAQPAEIDANAFAQVVMCDLFHMRPMFRGLPDDIKTAIDRRASEISAEIRSSE